MSCPVNKPINKCPCEEFSKEMLCDHPHRNTDKEIMAIELWGHRLPYNETEVEQILSAIP